LKHHARGLIAAIVAVQVPLAGSVFAQIPPATPTQTAPPPVAPATSSAPGEVVVAADRAQLFRGGRDGDVASSVIRGEPLRQAGAVLSDVMRSQPGVQITSAGSSADLATAMVRGATASQLPVYVAGIRINDDLGGTADLSTVPLWMLDRVEIYRGNAPIDADRPGIAGALFLDPRLPRGPRLLAGAGVGSYGWREAHALASYGTQNAAALVAVRHEQSTNDYPYFDDRGTAFNPTDDRTLRRPNADASSYDVWTLSRLRQGDTTLTLISQAFSREQGAPGALLSPSATRLRTHRWLLGARATSTCGSNCRFEIKTSSLDAGTILRDPGRELDLGTTDLAVDATRVEPGARVMWTPADALALSFASDIARENAKITTTGTQHPLLFAHRNTLHTALHTTVTPWRYVRVAGLVSVERFGTAAEGIDPASATPLAARDRTADLTPLSARLSAVLGTPALSLVANVSRAVRPPTLGELYGQSALVRGNAKLAPEDAIAVDAGVRGSRPFQGPGGRWIVEIDAFAYQRHVDGLIAFERSSSGSVRPYNVGAAALRGAEVSAGIAKVKRARLLQALTLLDARDVTDGRSPLASDILPLRARLVSASTLSITWGDLIGARGGDVGAVLSHQSSRYADRAGLVVLPAQTQLDLDLSLLVAVTQQTLVTARIRASNVTSAQRVDIVGYPLPPRQLFGTIEVEM
jgi:iron complex outermembrane receptor protein